MCEASLRAPPGAPRGAAGRRQSRGTSRSLHASPLRPQLCESSFRSPFSIRNYRPPILNSPVVFERGRDRECESLTREANELALFVNAAARQYEVDHLARSQHCIDDCIYLIQLQ
ncbi:unnamed protein product [Colias eurytheme]|nr:unnamed protein product [Colias eurytheme]